MKVYFLRRQKGQKNWEVPGIEPGTTPTRKEYHTTRPNLHNSNGSARKGEYRKRAEEDNDRVSGGGTQSGRR